MNTANQKHHVAKNFVPVPKFDSGNRRRSHHEIDFSSEVVLPDGYTVEENSQSRISFLWDRNTEGMKIFDANTEIQKGCNGVVIIFCHYNINVFSYLVNNPDQIPEVWEGFIVVFKGTKLKFGNDLRYPSLVCYKGGGCFATHHSLHVSNVVGYGRCS